MDEVVGNSNFQSDCINLLQQNEKTTNEPNFKEKWYSLEEDHPFQDFSLQMLNVAGTFFDLSLCVGYEFWTHNNTRPRGWHIDQDQKLVNTTGQTRFPLCSVVYYVKVEDLKGGKLHIEDDVITPKSNRMVTFSPKLNHCVEPFMGERITLCVNPWSIKL